MKKKVLASIICSFILYSCSQTLYVPASFDPIQQQRLLSGRKLYVDRCSGCHNLHLPKEYDATKWKTQLDEMQVKAKITDEEKLLVLEFLTSQP